MKRLREAGRQFLLQYGSPAVTAVVRDHAVFLGLADLRVNGIVLEDEDMHQVTFPERERSFHPGFGLREQQPHIFPSEQADAENSTSHDSDQ